MCSMLVCAVFASVSACDGLGSDVIAGGFVPDRGVKDPPEAASSAAPAETQPLDPAIADRIGDLFQRIADARYSQGQRPMRRAVFLKPHGCLKARFNTHRVEPAYRVGLFREPRRYRAWVRISSDTVPSTSDTANSTVGFGIKVLGVPGRKILEGEETSDEHDFLVQNHHVFFVDTAQDFLDFTEAVFRRPPEPTLQDYLREHPTTARILEAMEKPVANVLTSTYWSTTPYRFGRAAFAKYRLAPCRAAPSEPTPSEPTPSEPTPNEPTPNEQTPNEQTQRSDPNYLRQRLSASLAEGPACFYFQVQRRPTGRSDLPLDRATVEWPESKAPPVTLATLWIAQQDPSANEGECEPRSFTPWHALPAHRPVGSINQARGIVYRRMAAHRRATNQAAAGTAASARSTSTSHKATP